MGERWKRQQDVVCMYGTVNCAGTDGPLDAQAIIDAHNADCAAYEARIAKLEADKNHLRLERNAERATCRRLLAELTRVKAESLRVVADGDACSIDNFGGECFRWYDEVCGESHIIVSTRAGHFMLTGEKIDGLQSTDKVQPVRLDRWEEQA